MNAKIIVGIILIVIGIFPFGGALFEFNVARQNQQQYEENTDGLSGLLYDDEQAEKDKDLYEMQYTYGGICCSLSGILLIVGIILLIIGVKQNKKKENEGVIQQGNIQQAPQQVPGSSVSSPPPPSSPACPTCQGATRLVAEYNRHWCDHCQQYV